MLASEPTSSKRQKHPNAVDQDLDETGTDKSSPFSRGVQHEAKRGAILSRAAKLFNTKGARATTLSDVAQKLGLTKTSLYYYVRTKEDLIFQCYEATLANSHRKLDEIERQTSDPLERTLRFMERHIETILLALRGDGNYYAAPLELASLRADHREILEAEYLRLFKRIREYIRDGIASGQIRASHSTTTTRALIGALDWSFYWLYEMPPEESAKAGSALRTIIRDGLFSNQCGYTPAKHPLTPEASAPARGFDREAHNRLKQEAFFKAGTRFFNRKGFSGTSLDEIAEHLQVSKGAFYYHFANKEALLTQCYEYSIDQLDAIFAEVSLTAETAAEKLDQACRRIFHVQNSDLGPLIRYNTITALPPPIRRSVLARTEANTNILGQYMQEGIDTGEINAIDSRVAQNLLMGAINASMDLKLWRKIEDLDAAAVEYFDVFYFGLANHSP
ncbi:MAG: TetR/AcrR family transcriptional regulator [Halieaceae bacterium]|jgi:AcrR family transcriptional regulator|nr:TetR/AcrR family transcriptional regulator [Halieaceae bacterium]